MPITFPVVKVACVQAEPAWIDLDEGVIKTCAIIAEAAGNGAQLIAFSELWIPGYPHWVWSHNFKEYFPLIQRYMANSLRVDGPEMMTIRECVREHRVWICLGFSERHASSLYMSTCWINPDGEIVNHRRKLKPTFLERIIFGEASGDSLNNVIDTPLGRLGSLQCWEHFQPLLKYHTYSQHEQIHVAAWPGLFPHAGHEPVSFAASSAQTVSLLYAIESQAFTLMATQVMTVEGAKSFGLPGFDHEGQPDGSYMHLPGGGASMIWGPDGRVMAGPLPAGEEGILYATLDLADIDRAKSVADAVGHYSRPDMLRLVVDKTVARPSMEVTQQTFEAAVQTHNVYPPMRPAQVAIPVVEKITPESTGEHVSGTSL